MECWSDETDIPLLFRQGRIDRWESEAPAELPRRGGSLALPFSTRQSCLDRTRLQHSITPSILFAVRVITFLTDFGLQDAYVGTMKGVVLSINPHAQMVDLTHEVAAQDVETAAFLLHGAYRYFPAGTIHVVVVDPGVGGERRGLAGRIGDYFFVAPDNGVLSWVLADAPGGEIVELKNAEYFLPHVSRTFHGRDVFAPVAAHLSLGVSLATLGPPVIDPVRFDIPQPVVVENHITAQVIHVDRFGNLITNVTDETLRRWQGQANVVIEIAGQRIEEVSATYSAAASHGLIALFESSGHLEIAVREGSAAERLGVGRGAPVHISRLRTYPPSACHAVGGV